MKWKPLDLDSGLDREPLGSLTFPIIGGEPRARRHTGIKALMAAVLEDAIRAALSPPSSLRAEAERWIDSCHRHWPFSFTVVC